LFGPHRADEAAQDFEHRRDYTMNKEQLTMINAH